MMSRLIGLYAIIPATLVLAVSFFVLLTSRKVESAALKAFGYVVAALLWISALLVFSGGIYTLATGKCPMQKMMLGKRGMMCQMMMEKQMMGKPMMEKGMPHEMKR